MIRQIPPVDLDKLEHGLKKLKLRSTRDMLAELNELAVQEEPSYLDFLGYLVDHEIQTREEKRTQKRLKAAHFPMHRTITDFDFAFQTSITGQAVRDLACLQFIEAKENVILLGPPGVGKSHLAIALGIEAIQAGLRVYFSTVDELLVDLYAALSDGTVSRRMDNILRHDLVILDELGYVAMDQIGADHLFQLVNKAYQKRSLIVTSNLDFREWAELFPNQSTAAAILDRILHHAHIFTLKGESYRMHSRLVPPAKV